MADWERIHDILTTAERTVHGGIAVAHTFTTPEFSELVSLLLDARYENENQTRLLKAAEKGE